MIIKNCEEYSCRLSTSGFSGNVVVSAETSYQMYVRRFTILRSGQGLNSFIKSNLYFLMKEKKEKKAFLAWGTADIWWRYHWFPHQMTSAKRAQKIRYCWRVTTQIWVVLLIGWIKFPTRHDQSEAPLDLGSDASSVWYFCACFSNVISPGNQWWHREMSAVFSG